MDLQCCFAVANFQHNNQFPEHFIPNCGECVSSITVHIFRSDNINPSLNQKLNKYFCQRGLPNSTLSKNDNVLSSLVYGVNNLLDLLLSPREQRELVNRCTWSKNLTCPEFEYEFLLSVHVAAIVPESL